MKVCGIEIKGSEAILAVASAKAGVITHLPLETKRIALKDDDDSSHVKSFAALMDGFVRDNHISHVAIKKRSKGGGFGGGPTTFKIEGIIQLLPTCEVSLLSAPTISAANRKHGFVLFDSLFKYQQEAFLTACTALIRAGK